MGSGLKLAERDVSRQVKDFLEVRGWRGIRMQVARIATVAGGFDVGEPGMPDWLFLRYLDRIDGHKPPVADALWVEIKAPGRKPAPSQLAWHDAEHTRGAVVTVADDIDQFMKWYEKEIGR